MRGTDDMMPQKEVNETIHQQADPDYGRYEGKQSSYANQEFESSYAQDVREGPSGKVYPRSRDTMNLLRFVVPAIALVLLLLFGYLFVVVVGGMAGVISFVAACFVICCCLAFVAVGFQKMD
jgi:hypothetical protein